MYKEGLDPKAKTVEGVIRTLIYGVRSASAQTEELIRMIVKKDNLEEEHPLVALFLLVCRYVDDMGKAVTSQEEGKYIIETVDETFKQYQLKVKG